MYSMQGAVLAQTPVPWDTRAPAQDNGQRMRPHAKTHAKEGLVRAFVQWILYRLERRRILVMAIH